MPNVPQPFGYSPQNSLYNQPNNFTPSQYNQPQIGAQAQTSAGITVVQVPTIDHVDQVQMMPGDRKIVLVQNAPVIAIRIADQMGLVQTEYRHTEPFDPRQPQPQPVQSIPAQSEYVPMAEFEHLKSEITEIREELKYIKGGSNNGKPSKQPVSGGNVSAGTAAE